MKFNELYESIISEASTKNDKILIWLFNHLYFNSYDKIEDLDDEDQERLKEDAASIRRDLGDNPKKRELEQWVREVYN